MTIFYRTGGGGGPWPPLDPLLTTFGLLTCNTHRHTDQPFFLLFYKLPMFRGSFSSWKFWRVAITLPRFYVCLLYIHYVAVPGYNFAENPLFNKAEIAITCFQYKCQVECYFPSINYVPTGKTPEMDFSCLCVSMLTSPYKAEYDMLAQSPGIENSQMQIYTDTLCGVQLSVTVEIHISRY